VFTWVRGVILHSFLFRLSALSHSISRRSIPFHSRSLLGKMMPIRIRSPSVPSEVLHSGLICFTTSNIAFGDAAFPSNVVRMPPVLQRFNQWFPVNELVFSAGFYSIEQQGKAVDNVLFALNG
jgi:hypothetical protein